MGTRYFDELAKRHITFMETWGNKIGIGRYYKRRLSKARRRYAKDLIKFGRGKEPTGLESEINWRGW